MSWFPRPEALEGIDALGSARHDAPTLWSLLTRPAAEEWKDRVGVVGARNGSAKPTVRLLHSDGRVLKTDLALRHGRREDAVAEVVEARRHARAHPIWHPDKEWFVMAHHGGWLVISVCPRLTTLREIEGLEARLEAWIELLCFALRCARRHGLGLDLNPANFGHDVSKTLRYIDDEWYAEPTGYTEVGEFVAARLLEEDALESRAHAWASALRRALRLLGTRDDQLGSVAEAVAAYPLPPRRTAARQALLDGLLGRRYARGPAPSPGGRTCVLGDVHANRPALDAVLAAVQEIGVDDYLVLGDLVGYGPHPAECVERLAHLPGARILRGNHDTSVARGQVDEHANRHARWTLSWSLSRLSAAQRNWLGALPAELSEPGMLAVHGAPRDPERVWAYVYQLTYQDNLDWLRAHDVPLCFHGHTHVPFVYEAKDEARRQLGCQPLELHGERRFHLVNPGSVGQPRDGDTRASFLLWDRREAKIRFHRVPYPVERTTREMARQGFPEDLMRRLCIGR